jgi:hypothetical protein
LFFCYILFGHHYSAGGRRENFVFAFFTVLKMERTYNIGNNNKKKLDGKYEIRKMVARVNVIGLEIELQFN